MNYYPFHLGDSAAHTAHLEPLEDLAYRRMLDAYYMREGALPADPTEIARLIRMRQHQSEVESVLCEFFVKSDDGWHSKRADQELTTMLAKQEHQSAKNAHEAERMSRHRERRAKMFTALRALGIVPACESPRVLRRLHTLRRWSNEQEIKPFFTRGARTCCSHGARTPRRVPIPLGHH